MANKIEEILPYYPDLRFQYDSYDHKKAVEEHNSKQIRHEAKNHSCWYISDELKKKYAIKKIGRIQSIVNRSHGPVYKIGHKWPKTFYHTQLGVDVKPMLRSLSKLTDPITVEGYNDGKPFVPSEHVNDIHFLDYEDGEFVDALGDKHSFEWVPFCIVQLLLKWHFNVFNLTTDQFVEIEEVNNG